MGEFTKHINMIFPDKTLYLFDTFEGFDKRDVEIEHEKGFSKFNFGHLKFNSEEKVDIVKQTAHKNFG